MNGNDLATKADIAEAMIEFKKLLREALKVSAAKQWLKGSEVKEMLGISTSGLQNLRINGFPHSKIGGIHYYNLQDILNILEKNKKGGDSMK